MDLKMFTQRICFSVSDWTALLILFKTAQLTPTRQDDTEVRL